MHERKYYHVVLTKENCCKWLYLILKFEGMTQIIRDKKKLFRKSSSRHYSFKLPKQVVNSL